MIEIRVKDKKCDVEAMGAPGLLVAELCGAAESLLRHICDSAPRDVDKDELKTELSYAMITTLMECLMPSTEGGSAQ